MSTGVAYRRRGERDTQVLDPDDLRHGTANGYNNLHCRCIDCTAAWRRYYREKHYSRLARYRLTLPELERMVEEQMGMCAVCPTEINVDITDSFHVDHDHKCCPGNKSCGKCVRGLLCTGCNFALGQVNDDPNRLISLAAYLESRALTQNG